MGFQVFLSIMQIQGADKEDYQGIANMAHNNNNNACRQRLRDAELLRHTLQRFGSVNDDQINTNSRQVCFLRKYHREVHMQMRALFY